MLKFLKGDELVALIREGLINPAVYPNARALLSLRDGVYSGGVIVIMFRRTGSKKCDTREIS
jgi:hypothetical protein